MQLFKLSLIAMLVALGAALPVIAMEKPEAPTASKRPSMRIKSLKVVNPTSRIAQMGKQLEPSIALAYGSAKAEKENPQPRRAFPITEPAQAGAAKMPPPPPGGMRSAVDGVLFARLQEELQKIADLEKQLQRLMTNLEEMQRQGQVQDDLKNIIEDLKEFKKDAQKKAEKLKEEVLKESPTVSSDVLKPSWQLDKETAIIGGAIAAGTVTTALALYKWCAPFQQRCITAWARAKQGAYKTYNWVKEHRAITSFFGGTAVGTLALGSMWWYTSPSQQARPRK